MKHIANGHKYAKPSNEPKYYLNSFKLVLKCRLIILPPKISRDPRPWYKAVDVLYHETRRLAVDDSAVISSIIDHVLVQPSVVTY